MALFKLAQLCLEKKIFTYTQFKEESSYSDYVKYIYEEPMVKAACRIAYKKKYEIEKEDPLYYFRKKEDGNSSFFVKLFLANNINPKKFAESFITWISRGHSRKNTLFLFGDIKTGKTLIANILKDLYTYKTWVNSTTSTFSFGNLTYANLIHIDEPFLTPLVLEDFKSLTCGSTLTPDVKYEEPTPIKKTPLLITSNFEKLGRGYAPPLSEESIKDKSWCFHFSTKFDTQENISSKDFITFIQEQCPDIIHTKIINHMVIRVQKMTPPTKKMKRLH